MLSNQPFFILEELHKMQVFFCIYFFVKSAWMVCAYRCRAFIALWSFARLLKADGQHCVCANTRMDPSTEVKVLVTGQYSTPEHGVNALTFGMIRNHAMHNLALNTKRACYCSVSRRR